MQPNIVHLAYARRMSRRPPIVPVALARKLFLDGQGLLDDPARRGGPQAVYKLVERMGFVQIDSIQVVERAHHLILAARLDAYRPGILAALLERDRRLFEHWTHDAAAIPSCWYTHWRPRFERARRRIAAHPWWRARLGPDAARVLAHVRDRIRAEGPLQSRDFEHERSGASGAWWGWTPQKAALEYLWHTGELLIARRAQFHKVYDLAERVLPAAGAGDGPDPAASLEWACRAAIDRLAVATTGEIARFWGGHELADVRAWCARAAGAGTLVAVRAADVHGGTRAAWAIPDWERRATRLPDAPQRVRLLAPFDPVLRDRARTQRLFGFEYAFEAFTPASKRRYGYYVLPILQGERLTGRADAARDGRRLVLSRVWWEPGVRATRERVRALRDGAARLADAVGLEPSP
jgi:uncharacterized protein YcaQ